MSNISFNFERFSFIGTVPLAGPIFMYKLRHNIGASLVERYWLGGNLATPIPIPNTQWSEANSGALEGATNEARLTRDRTKVVYNWGHPRNFSAPRIKIGPTPGNSGSLIDIAVAGSTSLSIGYACFNGDDTKVVYARSIDAAGHGEIRIVNIDGTGDTLLYSRGGTLSGELLYVNIESLLVNHAGTKIAWFDQSQAVGGFTNAGIYVMNIDGTGVTRLVNMSTVNFTTSDHLIGFSHDDTYLGYIQTFDSGTGNKIRFRKVTMAGAITEMYADAAHSRNEYDFQWLTDDSGILAIRANVYATQPRHVIEIIPAAGGSPVALSPERRLDSIVYTLPRNYPVVCDVDSRIYWFDVASNSIVSVAQDGSNYRTDHTLDATHTDTQNDQEFRTIFYGG